MRELRLHVTQHGDRGGDQDEPVPARKKNSPPGSSLSLIFCVKIDFKRIKRESIAEFIGCDGLYIELGLGNRI